MPRGVIRGAVRSSRTQAASPVRIHAERAGRRLPDVLAGQAGVGAQQDVLPGAGGDQPGQLAGALHMQPLHAQLQGQRELGIGLARSAERHRRVRQQLPYEGQLAARGHLEAVHEGPQRPQDLGGGIGLDRVEHLRAAGHRRLNGAGVRAQPRQVVDVGGQVARRRQPHRPRPHRLRHHRAPRKTGHPLRDGTDFISSWEAEQRQNRTSLLARLLISIVSTLGVIPPYPRTGRAADLLRRGGRRRDTVCRASAFSARAVRHPIAAPPSARAEPVRVRRRCSPRGSGCCRRAGSPGSRSWWWRPRRGCRCSSRSWR